MGSNILRQPNPGKNRVRKSGRKRTGAGFNQVANYDSLEDRRVLASFGSFDLGTGLLSVYITDNDSLAAIGHDNTNVTLNGSVDLDPNTAGLQSAGLADVRSFNVIGDSTKTNQSVTFGSNFLNSNGALLRSITVNNVRTIVFNNSYQLAENLTLNLNQSGGQISDGTSGRLLVAGTTTLNSGDNPINLDNLDHDFGGNVFLKTEGIGRKAIISDVNNLQFSGIDVSGDLTVVAGGNVTDVAGIKIVVGNDAQFNAANITLGDSATDNVQIFQVGFDTPGNVEYTAANTVRLNTTTANNLTVRTSFQVFDGQSSVINVTNLANLNGTLRVRIGENGTDRFNAGSLTFNSAGHVHITEDSAMHLVGTNTSLNSHLFALGAMTNGAGSSITITNNFGMDAQSINLGNALGDQLSAGGYYFYSTGVVAINSDANIHIVEVNNEASQLTLVSAQAITDQDIAETRVVGNASFNAQSVNIGDSTVDLFNAGTVTFSVVSQFQLSENSTTVIAGTNTATVSIMSSSNVMTNAANATMSITNTAAFFGQNGIDIGNQTGDLFNFGGLTVNSPSTLANVSEDSATELRGISSVNSLRLTSTGAITDVNNATIFVTNNASFTGTSIILGDGDSSTTINTLNMGSVTFTSTGAVSIKEDSAILLIGTSSANSLNLDAAGTVFDNLTAITNVATDFFVKGTIVNLGASVVGDPTNIAEIRFQRLNANTTGNTTIFANSAIELFGNSRVGNLLNLVSTGNITDDPFADTRVTNAASFDGVDVIIGELATDCFDIINGSIAQVTVFFTGIKNVVEANC